jgi:hypothetical protein
MYVPSLYIDVCPILGLLWQVGHEQSWMGHCLSVMNEFWKANLSAWVWTFCQLTEHVLFQNTVHTIYLKVSCEGDAVSFELDFITGLHSRNSWFWHSDKGNIVHSLPSALNSLPTSLPNWVLIMCHDRLEMDWTKVRRGKRTYDFHLNDTEKTTKYKNERYSTCSAESNYTQTRSHNLRWEKGLPKYDPQSETMINSCLWLGTILGQQGNRNIHLPTQVTLRPNQIENKRGSLRSGRDIMLWNWHWYPFFPLRCSQPFTLENSEFILKC